MIFGRLTSRWKYFDDQDIIVHLERQRRLRKIPTELDRIRRVPAISWPRDYLKAGDVDDSVLGSGLVADQSGQ